MLKGLAKAFRSRLRSYDPVVRVGGDEFVCAVSDATVHQARQVFGDIQDAFSDGDPDASVTVGLAELRPEDSLAALIERADLALRETRAAQAN